MVRETHLWKFRLMGLVILFSLAGCSALPFKVSSEVIPCPGIKVGVLIGEDTDPIAEEQRDGYELALQKINANGGPAGCPFSLVYRAEAADGSPNQVYRTVRTLVEEDQVAAILGGTSNQASMFAASLANRFSIPFIIPTSGGAHILPTENHWAFRMDASDVTYSQVAFEMLKEELGTGTKVVIIFENTTPGNDAAIVAANAAGKNELTLAGYIPFDSDKMTFDRLLEQVEAVEPDVVYLIFNQPSLTKSFFQTLDQQKILLPITIVQGSGFGSRAFLYDNKGEIFTLADRVLLTTPWIYQPGVEGGAQFAKDFAAYTRSKHGQAYQPSAYSAKAYQSLMVLASTVGNGTVVFNQITLSNISTSRENLRGALQSYQENQPLWGKVSFSSDGQNQANVYMTQILDDKAVECIIRRI